MLSTATEGNQDAALQTDGEATPTSEEHIDLEDVTHIITMTMQFRDHEAIVNRNNQVLRAAEASGKQISTAPNATGRRGDLIAVVTVRVSISNSLR